jgi:hypothetical protein
VGVSGQHGARPANAFRISSQESPARICIQTPHCIPHRVCRSGIARQYKDRRHSNYHRLGIPTACQAGEEGALGGEDQAACTHHDRNALFQASRTRRDHRSRGHTHRLSHRRVSQGARYYRAQPLLRAANHEAPKMSASPMDFQWYRLSLGIGLDGLERHLDRRCMPRRRPQEASSLWPSLVASYASIAPRRVTARPREERVGHSQRIHHALRRGSMGGSICWVWAGEAVAEIQRGPAFVGR